MSQLNSKAFQLSILVAAMLSLSACSTTPTIAGIDLGKVGSKTAELGSNAWEGTKNLLHIGPTEPELLDEVDLALMEDDANLVDVQVASNNTQLLPQDNSQPAWSDNFEDQPLLPQDATQPATAVFGEIPQLQGAPKEVLVLASSSTEQSLETPVLAATQTVPTTDLIHVVAQSESLWTIAKTTTGDANNWHVIADINNLMPSEAVYIGQKITIPADMVKPVEAAIVEVDMAKPIEATEIVVAAATDVLPVTTEQPATVALNIPEKSTVEEAVVATAEQIKPSAPANAASTMADATALKVGEGETLWDFAKRTTGDATNWKQIADKNLFDEKQLASIRPGQKIYVPTDIVRSRDANGVLVAQGAEGIVGGALPQNKEAIDATAAVLAGTNQPDGEIKIVEAAFQDNKGITPVTAESLSEEAALAVADNAAAQTGKVMVSGTYYPKAVYNQADFSSSLLMRVSPGTQLLVSKAIGPWLQVETDKGVGYVHSRDIK